ncbi:MAG: hypothetical protein ABIT01_08180 [Thermoanaerobaculia bacterium]
MWLAFGLRLAELRYSEDPVHVRFAEMEELRFRATRAEESLQILRERLRRIPEKHRPLYTPQERFLILNLKARSASTQAQAADLYVVSESTIARWEREHRKDPEKETIGSLLKPVCSATIRTAGLSSN